MNYTKGEILVIPNVSSSAKKQGQIQELLQKLRKEPNNLEFELWQFNKFFYKAFDFII